MDGHLHDAEQPGEEEEPEQEANDFQLPEGDEVDNENKAGADHGVEHHGYHIHKHQESMGAKHLIFLPHGHYLQVVVIQSKAEGYVQDQAHDEDYAGYEQDQEPGLEVLFPVV